jgi:hypothetical protein
VRMTIALKVVGALLFLGAAVVARNEARLARSEATAWDQLITLRYDAVAATPAPAGRVLPAALTAADVPQRAATVEYWLGRYDDLAGRVSGDTDPEVLFVAANAAYRVVRRDHAVGPETARRLEGVLQAYASVLKAAPRHVDAAYNFEYVARLRDLHALMKPPSQAKGREMPRSAGPIQTTDLPRGPSVHGLPGGPPPEITSEDFEILTPRDLGDREADPEQAPGAQMRRKG